VRAASSAGIGPPGVFSVLKGCGISATAMPPRKSAGAMAWRRVLLKENSSTFWTWGFMGLAQSYGKRSIHGQPRFGGVGRSGEAREIGATS
jgi:hypothetical protein